MKSNIKQDLSLVPGEFYHPEAKLVGSILGRGHFLKGSMHGIWEHYQGGFLKARSCYLTGSVRTTGWKPKGSGREATTFTGRSTESGNGTGQTALLSQKELISMAISIPSDFS
jgi:hypothetical protein